MQTLRRLLSDSCRWRGKAVSDNTERFYAEMEAARNSSMDAYFEARPQLFRTIGQETLFKAGFERAFQMMWNRTLTVEEVTEAETKGDADG